MAACVDAIRPAVTGVPPHPKSTPANDTTNVRIANRIEG
jgi:hypothetical protein